MARIGELIADRYRVEAEIGRGGMATVYRVVDTNLDVERALKELSAFYAANAGQRAQFLEEARHAARLVHPNIVTIHDHFVWEDTPFIVMEYFPLGDVHELIGCLGHDQVALLLHGVLSGLSYAHASDLLHRDIKPENLMRTNGGSVKIGDFGIAESLSAQGQRTPEGYLRGSVKYVAPELLEGRRPSVASDLYSVGVVAYELLRGFTPFASDKPSEREIIDRKLHEAPIPISVVVGDLNSRIAGWIDRSLQRDPGRRYQRADDALEALGSAADRAFGAAWEKNISLPIVPAAQSLPPMPVLPPSRFARYEALKDIVSPLRWLVLRAMSRPLSLAATLFIGFIAVRWEEWWLLAFAAITFAAMFALTFFDQREAYIARGIGRGRRRRGRDNPGQGFGTVTATGPTGPPGGS